MISQNELKKIILEYLSQNKLMSLATSSDDNPWASTVFFAYDDNLNFYFLTEPGTRKAENIEKNPRVSATINEEWGGGGKVKGIQLEGEASETEDQGEIKIFLKRHHWARDYITGSKIFKVIPKKIIYLDDEKFGPGGKEELLL